MSKIPAVDDNTFIFQCLVNVAFNNSHWNQFSHLGLHHLSNLHPQESAHSFCHCAPAHPNWCPFEQMLSSIHPIIYNPFSSCLNFPTFSGLSKEPAQYPAVKNRSLLKYSVLSTEHLHDLISFRMNLVGSPLVPCGLAQWFSPTLHQKHQIFQVF